MDKKAYLQGYMYKEAADPLTALGILATVGKGLWSATKSIAGTGKEMMTAVLPATLANAKYIALGLPLAAGGAAGYLHSRLTSPSPVSKELIQKKLVLEELRQALAEEERRRAAEIEKELESENDRTRSSEKREIHI